MSIIISNIGGDPLGESEYELKINDEVKCRFTHDRAKGLSECLRAAAEAYARKQWENHPLIQKAKDQTK